MSEHLKEIELLRKIQSTKGEELQRAFYDFVEYFAPDLKGFLTAKFGGADVEDLLQETFKKVFEKRHTLDASKSPMAFIKRIAKHAGIDNYRRTGKRPVSRLGSFEPAQKQHCRHLQEKHERLLAFAKTLPADYRKVFDHFYLEELPVMDIAELLGKTPAAIRTNLKRLRGMFRIEFESEES